MVIPAADKLLVVAGGLAAAAAVVTALAGPRVGLTVLAASLALAMLGLAVHARRADRQLGELGRLAPLAEVARDTRRLVRRSGQVGRRTVRHTELLVRRTGAMQQRQALDHERLKRVTESVHRTSLDARRARRDAGRLWYQLQMVASDTVRLARLAERLAPGSGPLPGLGGWAATAPTVIGLVDEVERRSGPVTVVECGSGTSTLFLALALARRGEGGGVVSLESDAEFAEQTRGELRRYGVEGLATVVDAPLVPHELPDGTSQPWFDLAGLPDLPPVDLLFVDGPVGNVAPQARYPALPLLARRLAPGAAVVLDDTNRADERAILERWLSEQHGVTLRVERDDEQLRSTTLRVV